MIAIIGIVIAAIGFIANSGNMFPPWGRLVTQFQNLYAPNILPDITIITKLYLQGLLNTDQYYDYGKKAGFSETWLGMFQLGMQQYVPAPDLVKLFFRQKIDRDDLTAALRRHGISEYNVQRFIDAMEYYPNPADLIRFAVREVYSPDIAERFGQYEDFPAEFVKEAAKVGMKSDTAKKYWAAHWDLPSITMGFEMLHRQIIDNDDLTLLLRALDVMPYWRDKLTEMSYRVLSRVDVRRMYRVGVLDEDGVLKAYKDLGYNDKQAQEMTDFSILYEDDEDRGLTRSSVINAFKDEIITREDMITYLYALGYSEKVVNFWTAMADYEKTYEEVQEFTNDLIDQYKLGNIEIRDIQDELNRLEVPHTYVDNVVKKLFRQKATKMKVPAKVDLENWLNLQIIEETYYVANMRRLGYRDIDIQYYLTEIAMKQDTSKRKYLTLATYSRWYINDIIDEHSFETILKDQKYSKKDIERIFFELEEKKHELK